MTIDTAPKNVIFTHRGRTVFWSSSDHLTPAAPGLHVLSPDGDAGVIADVLRDGRCVISWDEHDTTETICGWRVED